MERAGHFVFRLCLISILLTSILKCGQAQDEGSLPISGFNKTYFFSYWHDSKKLVSEPFRWKAKQWSTVAGIAGIMAVAYVYDKEIYSFFQRNTSRVSDNAAKYAVEPWGSGLYSIPLLATIYLTGLKNNHHKNVALTGLKAFLLSGGSAVVAKHLFHRHRPVENDPPSPYLWDGPYPFATSHVSFPSGHTTTAFAVASALAQGYKDKWWVGVLSYSMATMVGISRIHDGKHWASDVVAGAALGTFIGTALSRLNLCNESKLSINITPIKDIYGLRMTWILY